MFYLGEFKGSIITFLNLRPPFETVIDVFLF